LRPPLLGRTQAADDVITRITNSVWLKDYSHYRLAATRAREREGRKTERASISRAPKWRETANTYRP